MARPKKSDAEKRSQVVNMRFTLAEHEHLRAQAESAGLSVSDYVRRRAIGYTVPPAPSRATSDPALLSELNRIGVNVNQLARASHRGAEFTRYWRDVGAELSKALVNMAKRHGS